jgi:hypothetical protein
MLVKIFSEVLPKKKKKKGSSVNIATRLWDGRPDFNSQQGLGIFFSPPHPGLWDPPGPLYNGSLFPGIKRPGRKADHSHPSTAIPPLTHTSSWHDTYLSPGTTLCYDMNAQPCCGNFQTSPFSHNQPLSYVSFYELISS